MVERILVLQQIQYACLDAQGQGEGADRPGRPAKIVAWVCDEGDVGVIENYSIQALLTAKAPSRRIRASGWVQSARFTTINGVVRPTFRPRPDGRSAGG